VHRHEGYLGSLEKRKIYVALTGRTAEKLGLIRVIDESGGRLSLSEDILSRDRLAGGGQKRPC
jgi:hypothetical protein